MRTLLKHVLTLERNELCGFVIIAVTDDDFFLSCRTKMFFKGCLTRLSLSGTGGIKLQASPGFIGGCQVKVGSLLSHSSWT